MREIFEAELKQLGDDLVAMSRRVEHAIGAAGEALLRQDLALAESVIADDLAIDALERDLDERCVLLLAQQQPVATDLRVVVSALRMSATLERMGDLADHVAKTALRRHPSPAGPAELRPVFTDMAGIADRMAEKIGAVLAKPDADVAAELDGDDDAMDDLHRSLFGVLLGDDWPYGVETAIDATLLGRFYERFADHAVNAGEHVVYLITGSTSA